jgi:hypothetical protein
MPIPPPEKSSPRDRARAILKIDEDELGQIEIIYREVACFAHFPLIANPFCFWPRSKQNAWFIWVFAGNMARLPNCLLYPLPWSGWARRGGVQRWYRTEIVLNRAANLRTIQ